MLDLESLRRRFAEGEAFEFLFFWGHRPAASGEITASCLSQWWEAPFTVDGQFYPTAEHFMMAAKAKLFDDAEILAEILDAPDPKTAKALGRKVRNFDDAAWKANARRLVTEGNIAKFSQNKDLKTFLLATEPKILVEASPYDRIWGIGMKAANPKAKDPATWGGQNLLGFALTDVRAALFAGAE